MSKPINLNRMKTLSIKQPWASLIAHGIKDIENRTWKTSYRGRVYIHASQKCAKGGFSLLTDEMKRLADMKPTWNPLYLSDLPMSAIIGEVEIIDCVINHGSVWAEKTPSCSLGYPNGLSSELGKGRKDAVYNWVLANAVLYDEPILNVKGKLSLWEFQPTESNNLNQ